MTNRRGVSPVVSVILMVGIVVILSALVFGVVLNTTQTTDKSTIGTNSAIAGATVDISAEQAVVQSVSGSGLERSQAEFTIQAGSKSAHITDVQSNGSFTVTGDTELLNSTQMNHSGVEDGSIDPGDSIAFNLNASEVSDDEVTVIVMSSSENQILVKSSEYKPGGGSETLNSDGTVQATVTVGNPTSFSLSQYQVKLNVQYQPDMQNDFDDLRFIQNGTNLPYYIVSKNNSSNATVWVRVASISSSGTTFTMDYGDSNRSSASDPYATMAVYDMHGKDGFSGQQLIGDAHTVNGGTSSEYIELTDAVDSQRGVADYGSTLSPGFYAEFEYYIGDGTGADSISLHAWDSRTGTDRAFEDPNSNAITWILNDHDGCIGISSDGQCGNISSKSVNPSTSSWESATFWGVKNGNTLEYYHSTLGSTMSGSSSYGVFPSSKFGFGGRTGGKNNHHWVREIVIRKYAGQPMNTSISYP